MIAMEFDEMKKIWDSHSNEPLYTINEQALHNRILSKKRQAYHITNFSELLWIIVNLGAGCFILGLNLFKQSDNISMYILSAWMLCTTWYMVTSRTRRIKGSRKFDRSMRGDLDHAISLAAYQVRLSILGRLNLLPIGILVLIGIWDGGKSVWLVVGTLILFVVANYAGGWEHRIYKARKRELKSLKDKLENVN